MIKYLIGKYQKLDPITQFVFWISHIGIILTCSFALLNYQGWHIPTDDEIHYSQGKIYIFGATNSGQRSVYSRHMELYTDDGKVMYFSCSYNAFDNSRCGYSKEYKERVHRKYGKIGWYIQKPILWIKNPYPQMVSLAIERDGVFINETTKEETIHRMLTHKKGTIFLIVLNCIMFYGMLFFAHLTNKPKQTEE